MFPVELAVLYGHQDHSNRQEIFFADRPVISRIKASRIYHETHIPTFQSQARTYARLSDAHENAWRPRSDRCTSRQRPQAPGRLSRLLSSRFALVQRLK